jgi:adenosylhomocysteine nucleosidase
VESAIHIFTAVEMEARCIANALRMRREGDQWASRGQQTVTCRAIGIGAVKMPPLDAFRDGRCIILAGFAGALDPALRVGDMVLDDCSWNVDFAGRRGSICASRQMLSTPEQKSTLFHRTGALAVDMESDAVRAWAARAGVPFLSIRAISDSADQSLNPALVQMINSFGRPKPMVLAIALLRRPMLIAELLRLRAGSKLAGKNLSAAVTAMIGQIAHLPADPSPSPPHAHLSDL